VTTRPQFPVRTLLALGLAAGLISLNSTAIGVALPMIGEHFSAVDSQLSQWILASYLLVSILFLGPAGKLSDLWGHGRMLRLGWLMFLLGALLGSFAGSIIQLVLARVIMGLGSALLLPASLAAARNSVPLEQRATALGFLAGGLAICAALGPPLGGFMVHHFGWQAVFWPNLPLLILSAFLARGLALPPPPPDPRRPRFDLVGSLLLMSLLAAFVVGMQLPGTPGRLLLLVALVMIGLFVTWELRQAEPVVAVRLFKIPAFSHAIVIISIQNLGIYGILFQMPYLLTELYNLPASTIGVMMLVTTSGLTICSPLGGYLASRLSNRQVTIVGSLLAAGGMFGLAGAQSWETTLPISPWLFLVGAGLGLNTGPVQATVLSAVAEKDAGMASGALSVFRYLGSILGVALLGWLLAQTEMPAIDRYRLGFQLYGSAYLVCFLLAIRMKLPVLNRY